MNKIIEKVVVGQKSKDEYQRGTFTKYIAEAAILVMLIDVTYIVIRTIYLGDISTDTMIGLGLFLVFSGYVTIRKLMGNITFLDINTENELTNAKRKILRGTILQGIMFFIVYSGLGYLLGSDSTWIINLAVSIVFALIMYLLNTGNAKKSLKVNKEFND
ncbi:hypothetical protein KXS12_26215 [Priestia filamentosa]|uniref:DUF6773 family protein n=1 Tax=Priestia filamentosa TaxID=1402861 RepID=UPI003F152789